ncbi:hypothetical protein KXD40_000110 [Peronospora effusa]|nr:hypothetical protein KXD40_000110 [Peronospora effusa]
MGAGPSLGKFLKSMDDADLIELVENAYKLEPQRMDKIFALVKERYCEGYCHTIDRNSLEELMTWNQTLH